MPLSKHDQIAIVVARGKRKYVCRSAGLHADLKLRARFTLQRRDTVPRGAFCDLLQLLIVQILRAPFLPRHSVNQANCRGALFAQGRYSAFQNRMDGRDLEPGSRLHENQPWVQALLCGTVF
jgi:hypothetical protein